jgi:hypothetical protein
MAFFAIVLLVSVGLCGLNLLAFGKYGAISGGTPAPPRSAELSMILMGTGFIELLGMMIGAGGLLVVGVVAIVRVAVRLFSNRDSDHISIIEKDKE